MCLTIFHVCMFVEPLINVLASQLSYLENSFIMMRSCVAFISINIFFIVSIYTKVKNENSKDE